MSHDYMIDGRKRIRYLHYKLNRKEFDPLLKTAIENQGNLSPLRLYAIDPIGENSPNGFKDNFAPMSIGLLFAFESIQ